MDRGSDVLAELVKIKIAMLNYPYIHSSEPDHFDRCSNKLVELVMIKIDILDYPYIHLMNQITC